MTMAVWSVDQSHNWRMIRWTDDEGNVHFPEMENRSKAELEQQSLRDDQWGKHSKEERQ